MGGKYLIAFREENWRRGGPSFRGGYLLLGGGIESINSLSLSLPLFLSNREIGEREIFLASSIYSPPRCSFYTTFCYRFRVGVEWEGGERGIREWAGRRKFVAFRQKSRTGQTGSPFSALFEPNFRQISPPLPRNWIVGFLHYGGESLPRFRERRL